MYTFFDSALHLQSKLPSMYSLQKKMYFLVSNNSRLTHPLARVFLKFVILSPTAGIYVLCLTCIWKKNANFLHFSVFLGCFRQFYRSNCRPFFYFLTILGYPFQKCWKITDHYRLPLLKNLKIYFQNLDVLMIWNRPTVYYNWNLSQIHPNMYTIIPKPCYFSSRNFAKS